MTENTPAPTVPSPATPTTETKPTSKPVTRRTLVWTVIIIVVLSFLGSLLGAYLAKGALQNFAAQNAVSEDEILPAGADLQIGKGAPPANTGADGDVYIDSESADYWVHREGGWQVAGNIRANAAANLSGEAGAPGPAGPSGAPGEPGNTTLLGTGAPNPTTCEVEGDVFIDTTTSTYYSCTEGEWTLFGPTPTPVP